VISVVIPTFNRVDSLKNCIESVMQQRFDGLELIVVDDGSSDCTAELLGKLKERYTSMIVISNPCNLGVNYTRNRGIEKASGKFILFLDSDDRLADGCLGRIADTINSNPDNKHFLFWVSDRKDESRNVADCRQVYYEDWIKATIAGDFTHVVAADVMKNLLFFEKFRMYEYLNWLRVFKTTSPQLLAPYIAAERERNRPDSLTTASRLRDITVIKAKFESKQAYYSLHHKDLLLFHSKALSKNLLAVVLLGVASNRKKDSYQLLQYSDRFVVKLAGSLILLVPPLLVRKFIIAWSTLKHTAWRGSFI
jgi:glycosyltransferase involved in cell wall biosynthesis